MKYIALIPSYEPDDKLIGIVKELHKSNFEIVVVNDGSSIKYNSIFGKCAKYAKVISYDINKGKGYALKTGLTYINDNYKDRIIVTMDSDGQHTVKDALKLCKIASKNDNTLVLGKRLRGEKTPLRSKIGNGITRLFFRLITGSDIYDTQTGLRAFNSNMIPFLLKVDGDRFDYEMNVLLDAYKNKIILKEENIDVIYENNNRGSHFKTIRDSYLIYKQLIKFMLSSISSFVLDYVIYALLLSLNIELVGANLIARLISANYNYFVNKSLVFHNKENLSKTIFKYYVLAIFVIIINTLLLSLLVNIGLNKYVAKLIVEFVLFIVSFVIQKRYIF